MIVVIGIVSIIAFAVALASLGIVPVARLAVSTSLTALGAMRDPALDDAVRERVIRRASLTMMGQFVSILARGIVVLTIASLPILFADQFGLAPADAVVKFLSRWEVMVSASLLIGVGWLVKDHAWPSE